MQVHRSCTRASAEEAFVFIAAQAGTQILPFPAKSHELPKGRPPDRTDLLEPMKPSEIWLLRVWLLITTPSVDD